MPEDDTGDTKADTVLSRKLKKVLDSRLENDKDTVDALKELSSFFTENNMKTRRNLRGEIERRNLQINQDFLDAFRSVKDGVESLHSNVTAMSDSCKEMQERLAASKSVTHQLMQETTEVQAAGKRLQLRQEVAEAWRERLALKKEDREVLMQRPGQTKPVDDKFFEVLEKVGRIRGDCKVLLAAGHQTAALATMERMGEVEEAAVERLYRWAQSAVRSNEVEIAGVSRALHHLQAREPLLATVLEEYTSARRAALVRSFTEALTVGGPGGTPRPIEMHAHEPARYVGDMLAWLHQALPGEVETITQLLRQCHTLEVEAKARNILASITEGVCRPLKTRVEQILVSEPGAVNLYRLTNLIRFYETTIGSLLKSPGCGLSLVLAELQQLSYTQFLTMLSSAVTAQLARAAGPGDLGAAPATAALLGLLREVLAGHSVADSSQEDLPVILAAVVDPLTAQLGVTAASLPSQDGAVFLINNLHQLRSTLSLYPGTEQRLAELADTLNSRLVGLSKEQAAHLLASLALAPILPLLENRDGTPLSTVPGCHPQAVAAVGARMDSLLSAPDILLLPATRLLLSSQHRKQVTQHAFTRLHEVYVQLYKAVQDPTNAFQPGLLPRSPDQIATLLQI